MLDLRFMLCDKSRSILLELRIIKELPQSGSVSGSHQIENVHILSIISWILLGMSSNKWLFKSLIIATAGKIMTISFVFVIRDFVRKGEDDSYAHI